MRVIRNREIRLMLIASTAAAVAIVALCVVLLVRVNQTQQFREQVAQNCMGLEQIKTQIRGVFNDNLEAVKQRKDIDQAQRKAIEAYYNRQLARFAAQTCPSP